MQESLLPQNRSSIAYGCAKTAVPRLKKIWRGGLLRLASRAFTDSNMAWGNFALRGLYGQTQLVLASGDDPGVGDYSSSEWDWSLFAKAATAASVSDTPHL